MVPDFYNTIASVLYQFVDFATRASNILDILLADDKQIITSVTADAPVGLSDHIMVTFKIVLVVGMTWQTISSVTERPRLYISGG